MPGLILITVLFAGSLAVGGEALLKGTSRPGLAIFVMGAGVTAAAYVALNL